MRSTFCLPCAVEALPSRLIGDATLQFCFTYVKHWLHRNGVTGFEPVYVEYADSRHEEMKRKRETGIYLEGSRTILIRRGLAMEEGLKSVVHELVHLCQYDFNMPISERQAYSIEKRFRKEMDSPASHTCAMVLRTF